jgi:hypothetical protein
VSAVESKLTNEALLSVWNDGNKWGQGFATAMRAAVMATILPDLQDAERRLREAEDETHRLLEDAEDAAQAMDAATSGVGAGYKLARRITEHVATLESRLSNLRQSCADRGTALEAAEAQLEMIDKIIGPQGYPDLPLVERAVLMRQQWNQCEALTTAWQREVEEARVEREGLFDMIPKQFRIHAREGGGPENPWLSLALSLSRLIAALAADQRSGDQ